MATLIDMPKLSDTMAVGTLIKWLKNEGDPVESGGDMIAEVETDKATMEVECFDDGILIKQYCAEGAEVGRWRDCSDRRNWRRSSCPTGGPPLPQQQPPRARTSTCTSCSRPVAPEPAPAPVVEMAPAPAAQLMATALRPLQSHAKSRQKREST